MTKKILHFFQKTLILVFEANSALSYPNGLFSTFELIVLRDMETLIQVFNGIYGGVCRLFYSKIQIKSFNTKLGTKKCHWDLKG